MEASTLSIIIICRNEERYIGKCIESALHATSGLPGREILVMDSVSTDETIAIARRYPVGIYQLLPHWRLTPAAGRYLGYLKSSGEYLLFLDGDSYLMPGFVERALEQFGRDSRVAAIIGRRKEIYYGKNGEIIGEEQDINDIGQQPRAVATALASALYRRSALQTAGCFNPHLYSYEEAELSDRLKQCGFKLLGIPCDMVIHNTLPRGKVSTFLNRMNSNFHLGPGQIVRYRFRRGMSRELLKTISSGFGFLGLMACGIVAAFLSLVFNDAFFISLWAIAAVMLFVLFVLKSRSVSKPIRYALIWGVQSWAFIRGFLMTPCAPESYPTDAVVIQDARNID